MNKKNNTKHVEKELTFFLEGELPDAERQRIQAHLASCERCAQALRELERLPHVLRTFDKIEPSETMFDEIKARIEPSFWHRFFTLRFTRFWQKIRNSLVYKQEKQTERIFQRSFFLRNHRPLGHIKHYGRGLA